jgi:hypothetical protein
MHWVLLILTTITSHLPDPHDILIIVFFGLVVYAAVEFSGVFHGSSKERQLEGGHNEHWNKSQIPAITILIKPMPGRQSATMEARFDGAACLEGDEDIRDYSHASEGAQREGLLLGNNAIPVHEVDAATFRKYLAIRKDSMKIYERKVVPQIRGRALSVVQEETHEMLQSS